MLLHCLHPGTPSFFRLMFTHLYRLWIVFWRSSLFVFSPVNLILLRCAPDRSLMHFPVCLFLCLLFFFDLKLSRSFVSFLLFSLLVCCVCVCLFFRAICANWRFHALSFVCPFRLSKFAFGYCFISLFASTWGKAGRSCLGFWHFCLLWLSAASFSCSSCRPLWTSSPSHLSSRQIKRTAV